MSGLNKKAGGRHFEHKNTNEDLDERLKKYAISTLVRESPTGSIALFAINTITGGYGLNNFANWLLGSI